MKSEVVVVIDGSTSMSDKIDHTVEAVNSYIAAVQQYHKVRVTVVQFAREHIGFDYRLIRERVSNKNWKPLKLKEIKANGTTPLFDAVLETQLLLAKTQPTKAQIVLVTDGLENSSKRLSRQGALLITDWWKKLDYQVVYIGADLMSTKDAEDMNIQSFSVKSSNLPQTMTVYAANTIRYFGEDKLSSEPLIKTFNSGGEIVK